MFMAAVLLSLATSSTVSGSGYYKLYDRTFTIKEDRLLEVSATITLVNTSTDTRITSVSWTIPTEDLRQVKVWDDVGDLNHIETPFESYTMENVFFRGRGVGPSSELTFYVSYTAGGMVSGTGVEYRAGLGGVVASDLYDNTNYIIKIRGPPGTYFFSSDPQAQLVENDPPMIRYATTIQVNENFEGLRVRFYDQPAFYTVILRFPFTNYGTNSSKDLDLDAMLFNSELPWQFSALVDSSHPIQTMYVDEENNWHGVFKVSELTPSETETVTLELLYEVQLYDPGINADDVGSISKVPASLQGYLKQDDKWESENEVLQQAADTAAGGETNVYLAAEKISGYVVDKLNYHVQDERRGALWAYLNETGDCSEYTDLSIALARASRIPARAMYGWGYYEEENLRGHAWLEYYFPGIGWQPADPTWDETYKAYFARLDPIHLTRNVRGLSSGESGVSYTYYGAPPTLSEGETTIIPLARVDAALDFVIAAQYAVNLADALLAASPDERLSQSLQLAQASLDQAKDPASDENQKISHAKQSIESASEVIRALGKSPAAGFFIDLWQLLPFVLIAGGLAAVVVVIYKLRGRRA